MNFALETWGKPLIAHAWEDFWVYDDVPEDLPSTPEFDAMFMPWFVLGFIPDPEADEARDDWPAQPIGLEWLTTQSVVSDLDRAFIEAACRSPLSVLVVEHVTPQRSLDLKDVLTRKRFHVLEQGASQHLRRADLLFTRVVTLDGAAIMFGASPFIVPPVWHTHIIDWRERLFRRRLLSREDLEEFEIETRELYLHIAAELLNPAPPRLTNTDGDPLALTTLTYELKTTADEAFKRLAPLARMRGDDHVDEITRDESGTITSAVLSWAKTGNRQHKGWDNTILGTLRLEGGRLVVDINSARRAERVKREIAKRLAGAAVLIDSKVIDPSAALAKRRHERASGTHDHEPVETSPELQALEKGLARRHWEGWLETRVPALGNKTPRQAMRTKGGRERLEALLAQFERDAEGQGSASADVDFLRSELGLTKPT